jgi:sec-independent protein translocase protein TatB
MFDISFPELVVVGVIALLVLGPDRLPGAQRTLGLWVGRMSRTFSALKTEIEREIGMDEIRRQLHNEAVMDELKRIERDVRGTTNNGSGHAEVKDPENPAVATPPAEAPVAQVSTTVSNDTQPRA